MNRKVLRIILAVIWFVVAILSYTRNEMSFTIISAILGVLFLVFAFKPDEINNTRSNYCL
ncbi:MULTISPECIES: hypothetical protein [Anaerococcus]|mgnify:CR=1 FL=1|uniref:Uncharacterized protein n=1 Tax=Anaerococcus octavius TaxID=54007 RepID=A0A2I1MAW6_9FIRM|nr:MULTISPECIES: hypothetical protein [Anaerococcus]MBS6105489.1 hypothetical protein [Anaerococcus sp.]MDU0894671.1 hypothetical protein [Anaerococcus sp.]MDU3177627.1 hypothetical protein [Anaerococcus sp.]PKZ17273.1 hypothetical protein CYJ34_00770 [Anaerococcus octavius]